MTRVGVSCPRPPRSFTQVRPFITPTADSPRRLNPSAELAQVIQAGPRCSGGPGRIYSTPSSRARLTAALLSCTPSLRYNARWGVFRVEQDIAPLADLTSRQPAGEKTKNPMLLPGQFLSDR